MSASSGSGKRPREQASAGSSAPSSHKQPIWVWRLRADMQTLGMSAAQLQSLLINICKPLVEENRGSVSDVKYNAALVCAFPVMAQYQQHHQLTAAATAISDGSVSSSIQQQSTRPANLEVELHNFLFCEGAGKQRNSVQRRLKQLFSAAAAQTHDAKTFEALLLAHMMGTLKPSTYVEVANVLGQAPLHRALLAPAIQSRHGTDFRSFLLEAQFGTFRFTADDAQMHQRVRMGLDLMGPPTRSASMRRSRATSLSLLRKANCQSSHPNSRRNYCPPSTFLNSSWNRNSRRGTPNCRRVSPVSLPFSHHSRLPSERSCMTRWCSLWCGATTSSLPRQQATMLRSCCAILAGWQVAIMVAIVVAIVVL